MLSGLLCCICAIATAAESSDRDAHEERDQARAEIERLRGDERWFAALARVEQFRERWPDDPVLYRNLVLTLADLGASHRAWTLYRLRPELFDGRERERLEGDRLARLATWGDVHPEDPAAPQADARRAEAAFARYRDQHEGALPLRIRLDRLLPLNRLGQHDRVIAEYEALRAEGIEVPGYALGVIADSLLALRRPAEALVAVQPAIESAPGHMALHMLHAYAELEREQPDRALRYLESLRELQPPWLQQPEARQPYQNWHRFEIDLNLALMHAFAEDHPSAQRLLEDLLAVGPANARLQATLGSVYLWRGWPEQALQRYRMARTLDPLDASAAIGEVEALLRLQRREQARPIYETLLAAHPDNRQVQRLARSWQRSAGWRLRVRAEGSRSSGADVSVSPQGSRDRRYLAEIDSPLLADRWRITAAALERWAEFRQQRVEDRRYGLGLRYSHDRLDLHLRGNRPEDGIGGSAFGLDLGWRLGERWHAGLSLWRNDPEGSLQARAAGIAVDSLALSASYRRDERSVWRFGAQQLRFDDGNRRHSVFAGSERRLYTRAHWHMDGLGGIYASTGSADDAPYFNPSRDASLTVGIRADHLLWRRYERRLRHRLSVQVGSYWQQHHGSALTPSVDYLHDWQFAHGWQLLYGLNWALPVYDGQRERRLGLHVELRWGA